MEYNLEERTASFSEDLIDLCKGCPKNIATVPILDQLMRSGTSIGANYYEANGASSKRDFRNKISICKREGKETQYWLRLLMKSCDSGRLRNKCDELRKEAKELTLIFSKIVISTKPRI